MDKLAKWVWLWTWVEFELGSGSGIGCGFEYGYGCWLGIEYWLGLGVESGLGFNGAQQVNRDHLGSTGINKGQQGSMGVYEDPCR